MTIQYEELFDGVYKVDSKCDLSMKKLEFLTKVDKMTSLVLSKKYDTIVSVVLGNPETGVFSMVCNGTPIQEEIDWNEIYKETKEHHENMLKFQKKSGA